MSGLSQWPTVSPGSVGLGSPEGLGKRSPVSRTLSRRYRSTGGSTPPGAIDTLYIPRPNVAATRSWSSGSTVRSEMLTFGMPLSNACQDAPPSVVRNTPTSVPT